MPNILLNPMPHAHRMDDLVRNLHQELVQGLMLAPAWGQGLAVPVRALDLFARPDSTQVTLSFDAPLACHVLVLPDSGRLDKKSPLFLRSEGRSPQGELYTWTRCLDTSVSLSWMTTDAIVQVQPTQASWLCGRYEPSADDAPPAFTLQGFGTVAPPIQNADACRQLEDLAQCAPLSYFPGVDPTASGHARLHGRQERQRMLGVFDALHQRHPSPASHIFLSCSEGKVVVAVGDHSDYENSTWPVFSVA